MVEEAENKQAPTQRIADKWASRLVPIALMIAVLAFAVTGDIVRGVTVMVVFCPCALVLSTPTAIMAAIGQATKHGVIIKSGEALDKTGTLTCGSLEVSDILPVGNTDSEMLLRLAASAESKSEHPLGKAVTACAKAKGIELFPCDSFKMYAGKGIFAQTVGHSLCCGSERFLAENGVTLTDEVKKKTDRFASEGKASVIVAELGAVIGIITLSDVLRPGAKDMVSRLKDLGIRPVLLTGDNKNTAEHFAEKAGITEVMAELLPGIRRQK